MRSVPVLKSDILKDIYRHLLSAYGSQSWWPADTPFEVMLGAILTQNTAWANVEKAIDGLKAVCDLTPEGVLSLPIEQLQEAIRSSGYFRQKAGRLHAFCRFLLREYKGDLTVMEHAPVRKLRQQFLDLKGIGPETADSILLYALGKPVFVVDAYTTRLFSRLGLCDEKARYRDVQALFMDHLEPDAGIFNEYHALIVNHSKHTCMKRNPECAKCPLIDLCAWKFNIQDSKFKIEKQ